MYKSLITNISMCKCKVFRKKTGNNLLLGEARFTLCNNLWPTKNGLLLKILLRVKRAEMMGVCGPFETPC